MWLDIIISVVVVAGVIAACYYISSAFKRALNSSSTVLQNGYLFVHQSKKSIFFSDHVGANIWIKECSWAEVYWDVYALCDGQVKYLGNSKDLILSAL